MCGRYLFDEENEAMRPILAALEGRTYRTGEIFPTNPAPVLLPGAGEQGLRAGVMTWGLPQPGGRKGVLINARAETAQEKRTFREAVRTQRCVIPSSGFFEWRQDGSKQKFLFTLPASPLLCMAGFYREYEGKGRFIILTTAPNASVSDIHSRMPLVLAGQQIRDWLRDQDAALSLLQAVPPLLKRAPV